MGRGRKSFSSSISNNWEKAFFKSIGFYITSINKGLSRTFKNEPLKKHIKLIGGFAFKNAEYKKSGVPIIRISDFNNEKINLDSVVYYKEIKELEKYVLNESDIIIALTGGTIGKLGIVQAGLGKLYLNQRVGKFEVLNPEKFEKEYIYWIARGVEGIVKNLAWGAAIPNVSPKQIEELLFPIPSKEIQYNIILFLSHLRDNTLIKEKVYFDYETEKLIKLIQNQQVKVLDINNELSNQLSQIENLNQAILQEAVQGKLLKQNPKDEPASELLKRVKIEKAKSGKKVKDLPDIKAEEIPFKIPENWVWCRFQDVTSLITCGMASTPKYYSSGRIFLSAKNVKPFRFLPNNFKYVDEETYRKVTQNAKPEIGDVLITRVGAGIGETAVIDQDIDFAFYVSLTLVKPIRIGLDSNFLSYWLNSNYGIQNAIVQTSGIGSNQGNLNVNRVRTFLIPLPPIIEQKRIVAEIQMQLAKTKQLKEHIISNQQATEQLLKALLHQAFEVD